jgi:flagellar hook-associated protein 1 FlgK
VSLTTVLKTASSGMIAAQTGLRTVSDNIANVNTPGYVRKQVDQQPLVVGGMGMGVQVSGVKRVTDQYLQAASMTAGSDSSRWTAISQYLDNAQSLFGDPSGDSFYFNRLDTISSAFSASADDPSSSLLRSQALSTVQDFMGDTARINGQITQLGKTVDAQAGADVSRINDLLSQIDRLNSDVSRAKLANADSSGSENIQSGLIDELSGLMSIQVQQRENGGVTIRSSEGYQLAGDGAAKLSYNRTDATKAYIAIEPSNGIGSQQPITITGGELRGLMDLRDDTLPGLADQLGEFSSKVADAINKAHNSNASVPPPANLTGRNTGLDLATAASNFTGTSTVAVIDKNGVVQQTVAIDFTNGTMSANGGPATAFSPGSFLTDLNGALGGQATASFSNGVLSLDTTAPNGLAIDEGTSNKAGRGFSQFFGLNDLIRSDGFTNYSTGMTAADANGFTPGDTISFRLAQADGKPIRDVTVNVPGGGTMQDLLDALNSNASGVGLYGSFSLDANGKMNFASNGALDVSLSVTADHTAQAVGGASMSQLFGLGVLERSSRASRMNVDPALISNPTKLSLNKLDLTVAAGQSAIRPGDGKGALALSGAFDISTQFGAAGALGNVTMTVARYASEFGGAIGRQAAAADTRAKSSQSVATEATARRQSVEGVNLDEELVRLTTYQQAFNASARMIQAAKELFDVLTNMI